MREWLHAVLAYAAGWALAAGVIAAAWMLLAPDAHWIVKACGP